MIISKFQLRLFIFFSFIVPSEGQRFWTEQNQFRGEKKIYLLDTSAFLYALHHHLPIQIPLPGLEHFELMMEERSNFSPELAAKYSRIKSYRSKTSGPSIYLDEYENQIHIFQRTESETYFLEPVKQNTTTYELVTANTLNSMAAVHETFACKTIEPKEVQAINLNAHFRDNLADKINLKTYRLALAITAEFAFTLGNTKEKILAGLNSHLSRINAVYISENAIEFKLVPNNDTLIFTDVSNQPYSNGHVDKMITENPGVLNARIGLNNYDIGHVFGTNDGGLAQLSSVCTSNKAAAASCSFGIYSGLLFYTIPCHEMGHQFSATHIFNFCDNSNETSSSAFEPGSGSTIMSYAGASNCGQNYVQQLQDPYFHAFSLQQIKTYSRTSVGNLCGISTPLNNEAPQVTLKDPLNIIIPRSTPFELEGSGSDDKNTELYYTWEEMDLGPKSILGMPQGNAPLFRSFTPNKSPIRIFPALQFLLTNKSQINEVLPSTTRPLNFRFSARDNEITGGGTSWADISFQSTALAGPFVVNSLNDPSTIFNNDAQYISWDVAKTSVAPVLCKTVDILWSDDGGFNFTTILTKSTANDGGEWVTIPNTSTDHGRIKIKSVGNIFFDVNNSDIQVSPLLNPKIKLLISPDQLSLCAGTEIKQSIYSSHSSSTDTLRLVSNFVNDTNVSISFSKDKLVKEDSVVISIFIKPLSKPEDRVIKIFGINLRTGDTTLLDIKLRITSDQVTLLNPLNSQDQVATMPVFKWQSIPNTEDYLLEVSESPSFTTTVWTKNLSAGDTTAISEIELKSNQIYFWRIRSSKGCTSSSANLSTFHTQSLICKTYIPADLPKFISATGTPRIFSEINVQDSVDIGLVSIPTIRGTHDFIADLSVIMQAPSGDSIVLWTKQCNNLSNFNLGLDDQAPIALSCPLTDRKIHRPEQPFSSLQHTRSKGSWKLIIKDGNNGAGGSLDDWSLQLCGSVVAQGPLLITNSTLELFELKSKVITKASLEATDADSDASKIRYVLLQKPKSGNLLINGVIQKTGSTFIQSDINTGKLSFSAFNILADTLELISFFIVDENNNWSGVKEFRVKILNDPTLATKQTIQEHLIKAYPNPFSRFITLENRSSNSIQSTLFSIDGKRILSFVIKPLSINHYEFQVPSGIYFLRYFDGRNFYVVDKIIKQ
ncbi:MAG: reprolysin-like metallopeptidase [Saprospiraceae bacterium]